VIVSARPRRRLSGFCVFRGVCMRSVLPVVLVGVLALALTCHAAPVTGKKRDRPAVFEVPTTGKILDVEYRPEFDEWWVKCREAENISVFVYDPKTQTWGKVLFVPKKLEDHPAKVEAPKETTAAEKERLSAQKPPPAQVKPQTDKDGTKDDKKRWWDPMTIIKETEKLIRP
jgi:hypothetical protein